MDTHQRLDHCTILSTEAGNFGQAPNPAILFHAEVNIGGMLFPEICLSGFDYLANHYLPV